MKDVPENELFSAYLDGELTAAEQAEVEQSLARSPAARQLLEELRTLSSKLQTLPQYKLGEDLSQQVLRVAERRMLTEPVVPGDLARPAPPPRRAILRRLVSSRALIWSSLAIAVAVILSVANQGPQDRPADEGIARAPSLEEKGGAASEIEAASKASQQPDESRLRRTEPVLTVPRGGQRVAGAEGGDQPAPAKRPAEARDEARDIVQPPAATQASAEHLDMKRGGPAEGAPRGPSKSGPPSPPGLGGGSGNASGVVENFAAKGDGPQAGKGAASYGMKQAVGGVTGSGRGAGDVPQFVNGSLMTVAKANVQPVGGYAVVFCDLSPKAVQSQAFEQVLAVNGIAWEGVTFEANVSPDVQTDAADAPPDRRGKDGAKQQRQVADLRLAAVPVAGELDLVCVEATREQLEATLATLDAQPGEFLSFSVEPALGVEVQKDWGRQYGRGVQEQFRRSGGVLAGQAETSPDAGAVAQTNVPAQEQQAAEGEAKGRPESPSPPAPLPASGARGGGFGMGNQPSLGRAWRLQVPGPVVSGRLSAPGEDAVAFQSGTAVQPAGPAVSAPTQLEATQALLGEPGTDRRLVVAPAEQPGKSPDGGPRQDESSKAGLGGGRAVGQAAIQGGASKPGKGPAPGEPGSPQPKVPPPQSADKSQESVQSRERAGSGPPPQDQAKAKSAPQQKREQGQDLKQPQPLAQTYRVLFVLRMVGPDVSRPPAAAASMMEQAEPPAARDPEGTPPAAKQ